MRAGFVCALLALWISAAHAAAPADIPAQTSLLTDEANVLTVEEHDTLLSRVLAIQRSGRAQIAILISSGIGDSTLEQYALRVAETWEIGRKGKDDGLVILIVPSINGARLEVGYGLEGTITDARASQWLDDLIPAIRNKEIAQGLERLLDRIEAALPAAADAPKGDRYRFEDHPEWGGPFALVIFSLFSLFPMFVGRWGSIASAFILSAMLGAAAWLFWSSETIGAAVAAAVFPLPLLWGLNREHPDDLPAWLRYARVFGNLAGVVMFFAILTLFVGVGVGATGESPWLALLFSGPLTIGIGVFLFPGRPAEILMVVLRSVMHFIFILVVAFVALLPFNPDPARIAFAAAGLVTAFAALGLYLESRERRGSVAAGGRRWSLWLYGAAMVIALPFGVVALIMSIGGEDLQVQIAQAAAGGGSIAGILAVAARIGLIAAVKVGLGGRFGGGGAGRSG